jgi:hypothetical protein
MLNSCLLGFAAYTGHGTGFEGIKKSNVEILKNAVLAVEKLCPSLQFWTFQTGGKVCLRHLNGPPFHHVSVSLGFKFTVPLLVVWIRVRRQDRRPRNSNKGVHPAHPRTLRVEHHVLRAVRPARAAF